MGGARGPKWPSTIWIVRHGESAGNVAREAANAAQQHVIDIATRDVDVPLSSLGERQARALGNWFGVLPPEEQPTVILASPYVRAHHTADLICEAGGFDRDTALIVDERLREKEFGVLDRLTRWGITARYPEQAEFRRWLGKFYHRPPGGESWCDVTLRLRSILDTIARDFSGSDERVLIVAHTVVVHCFRYLFERMTEQQILDIDRSEELANCSVTEYRFDPRPGTRGKLVLARANFVAPLEEAGEQVTHEPKAESQTDMGRRPSPSNPAQANPQQTATAAPPAAEAASTGTQSRAASEEE